MKDFKQISNDVYYKMHDYHQLTIDLVEEVDDTFNETPENKNELVELVDRLGALSYAIRISLEIFNPIFEIEISDLKDLIVHIETKIDELNINIRNN